MIQVKPNLIFKGKTQKQNENEEDCQDHFNVTENCFAIADGASQSFYSSIWAKMLVEKFCKNPKINQKNWEKWLVSIQKKWLSEITERVETAENENKPIWPTNHNRLNSRESATSTFIGLQFIESENIFKVSIIGDSCLFVWDENSKSLESTLLKKASEFNDRPEYLASYPNDNRYEPEFFDLPLENKELYVILATDALSEWILKNHEQKNEIFSELIKISTQDEFENFVTDARNKPDKDIRMKNDDVTLVTIKVSGDSTDLNQPDREVAGAGELNNKQTGALERSVSDDSADVNTDTLEMKDSGDSADVNQFNGVIPEGANNQKNKTGNLNKIVSKLKRERAWLILLAFTLSYYIFVEETRSRREVNNLSLKLNRIIETKKTPEWVIIEKKSIVYSDINQENKFLVTPLSNSVTAVKIEESKEWIKFEIILYAWRTMVVENCTDCKANEIEVKRNEYLRIVPGNDKNPIFGKLKNQSKFELLASSPNWYKFKFVGYLKK